MDIQPDDEFVTVLMTAPGGGVAEAIAQTLVTERLAACANVVRDVVSLYRWEGEVRRDSEELIILKTTADGLAPLESRALELHPYDVPEVIALPIRGGHGAYLDWIRDEVG